MRNRNSGGEWVLALIAFAIVVWLLIHAVSGIGHLLGLTPTGSEVLDRDGEWISSRYEGVVVGYLLTLLVIGSLVGLWFLVRWARANPAAEERSALWSGAALATGLLAGVVITLPVGAREAPVDERSAVLAGQAESTPPKAKKRDEPRRERTRDKPDRDRAERNDADRASSSRPPGIPGDAKRTTILDVTDGDTVDLAGLGASRLIGVDTPEVYGGAECFGAAASSYASRRLPVGTTVYYAFDVERIDHYDRALVYLWLAGGSFFNAELAAEGYGVPLTIPPNVEYAELFRQLAGRARSLDRGLWASSTCSGNPDKPVGGSSTSGGGGGGSSSGSGGSGNSGGGGGCTPGYSPCLPPASDYDCEDGSGDGPKYTGRVSVTGSDPYGLDDNNDGVGCE